MVMQHHRQEWLHLGIGKLFQQIPNQILWEGWAPQLMVCRLSAHVGFPPLENLANQADRDQYELLCRENTRMPVDAYKGCHLARVPSHAVVARSVDGKEDLIWELLNQAQVSLPPVFPSCMGSLLGFGVLSLTLFQPLWKSWYWAQWEPHHMSSASLTRTWSGYVMGSSDHKTPFLGITNTMGQRLCRRPLLPHFILLGCIGILKLQCRCPFSRSCSPLIPLAWTPQQQVLTVSV